MNIKLTFTLLVSKTIIKICRLFDWGGTSLPGEIARKMYPDFLKLISRDFNLIMVTGTNGKTTTTLIIGKMLEENGVKYITNKSGANVTDGVATAFIESVQLSGKCKIKTALIEIDEAALNVFCKHRSPDVLVVTNFFRDQLDRFGELYLTLSKVKNAIMNSKNVKLILNADDSLCASLGKDTGRETLYFGIGEKAFNSDDKNISSDAPFCIYCKTQYEYSARIYGHLGHFKCPSCGFIRPNSDITLSEIKEQADEYSRINFVVDNNKYETKINLPGLYNIYNALTAIAASNLLKLDIDKSIKALSTFDSGFGRMETINASGKFIKIILVKNPTGFNQVLNYLSFEKQSSIIAFAINDKIADGTDVSWLWDVNFEALNKIDDKIITYFTSGIRATDMTLRLKYAGISTNKINNINDYNQLIELGLKETEIGHNFYILPTYTAMLAIRKILQKKYKLKEFWK